jgi:hypothetical protein
MGRGAFYEVGAERKPVSTDHGSSKVHWFACRLATTHLQHLSHHYRLGTISCYATAQQTFPRRQILGEQPVAR